MTRKRVLLARITRTFEGEGAAGELWHEALVDERFSFRFRAPKDLALKPDDVISLPADFVGRGAAVGVYSYRGGAVIHVSKEYFRDLSDHRVILALTFEPSQTNIRLLANGEVEVRGVQPGVGGKETLTVSEDVAELEDTVAAFRQSWLSSDFETAGPRETRASVLAWLETVAIPELKKAKERLRAGKP